jgi:hypothetical protein
MLHLFVESTGVMQPHLLSANLAKDLSDPSSTKISKDTPDPSSAGTVKDTPGLQLAESSKVASPSSSSVKTSKDLPDDEPDISLSEEEKKLVCAFVGCRL